MPTKFDPANIDLLLGKGRLDTHRLLSVIPVLPHHVVADIGCGPGYFTVPLAKFLFDGKVYALDVQKEMIEAAKERVASIRLSNVEFVESEEKKVPLEDGSLDGALLAFVLQEADNPRVLLKEALRCLRTTGWLAVLEWQKKTMDEGPPLTQRIDEQKMMDMAAELGFRFTARRDIDGKQYLLLLRK